MNFAERITGLYFRLNGFFLMPEFSTFQTGLEKGHAHVDLLAFRPADSQEIFEGVSFPLDAKLFKAFIDLGRDPFAQSVALVCEVRTNSEGAFPNVDRRHYAAAMCGTDSIISMCCDRSLDTVECVKEKCAVRIGLIHVFEWIGARIAWLNEQGVPKSESWTWSEPVLAELLVIDSIQPIHPKPSKEMFVWPPEGRRS